MTSQSRRAEHARCETALSDMSDWTIADAKRLMKLLLGFANFDEFRDDRERDGLNEAAAFTIRDWLRDNGTKK